MDKFYPGDIVSIAKDHRSCGICFLESDKMFLKRFFKNQKFLVLEVFEQKVKVVTAFDEEALLIGTFYKSWVFKEKKFNRK